MKDLLFSLARPLIHRLDAETAHKMTVAALAHAPRLPSVADDPLLATKVFGRELPNPVGLAAGFDKHAEAIDGALALGFGFVEVGGVTPLPQAGNARPRVFRLVEDAAVINRYGLNSDGADLVAERLTARGRGRGFVGVNLGANKDSTDRAGDYAVLTRRLALLADFLTINVSSPNTPGLRDLQGEAQLDDLVARVLAARDEACVGVASTPILLKIAPDLDEAGLDGMVAVALRRKVDGLIVSNTTIDRPPTLLSMHRSETGGLSGRPLFRRATQLLAQAAMRIEGRMPLIGVGGIEDAATALAKFEAGASLIQFYTAMVFKGPGLVDEVKRGLAAETRRRGEASLSALVGSRTQDIASGRF